MTDEPQGIDYEKVLKDLYARRDQILQAIVGIEAITGRSGNTASASVAGSGQLQVNASVDSPGAFLGMSIADAAKALLAARRQPLKNPDIAAAFKAGGLHLRSKDPVNTVGAVLTRRSLEVGDIVKIGRGVWGLKEWYPGRSFKKADNGDEDSKEAAPKPTMAERIAAARISAENLPGAKKPKLPTGS
jgi:hypothetical protein